jgi:uncharacterized protein YqgV (UPF0045/DUF77 family)
MIVEIQCLPNPAGTPERRYAHVEAAIAVLQASGLPMEVGPLGTSVEGQPDQLWPLVRRAHEAVLASGADGLVSVIKIAQSGDPDRASTMDDLVGKFR